MKVNGFGGFLVIIFSCIVLDFNLKLNKSIAYPDVLYPRSFVTLFVAKPFVTKRLEPGRFVGWVFCKFVAERFVDVCNL